MLVDPILMPIAYTGGAGIDVNGTSIDLDPATIASVAGAIQESQRNLANGFAGLDAQSALNANVNVQVMDRATANGQVIPAGRLVVISDTKALRFGDGVSNGGFTAGLGSENCLFVSAVGITAAEAGAQLAAAYAFALTMTPYGQPLSATNRVTIILSNGVYDLSALSFTLTGAFVDISGVTPQGVRVNFGAFFIMETCTDVVLRNLTCYKTGTTHNWSIRITDVPKTITIENVVFEGISTDTVISIISRSSGVTSQINWNLRNIKTACRQLCCGTTAFTGHIQNVNLENVECADRMFAPSVTANTFTAIGRVIRCRTTGANGVVNSHFIAGATFEMWDCDWCSPMNYLTTGARLNYVRFKPVAGTTSINGQSAGQSCWVAHCSLALTASVTPFTNTAGATDALAMNVRSDGV
jgi:hypothetical protein